MLCMGYRCVEWHASSLAAGCDSFARRRYDIESALSEQFHLDGVMSIRDAFALDTTTPI